MPDIQHKKLHLGLWDLLFKVLDEGSISRAARQYNLERSQVSRMLSTLEFEIGAPLLERNGKRVEATQAALIARKKIEPLIRDMEHALSAIRDDRNAYCGNIRFGAMPGFLQTQVVPLIAEFQQHHPNISFDVIGDDDPKSFMHGQCDLMLYYGPVNDNRLVEHWVSRSAFIPCASPEYITSHGSPKDPSELIDHAGVIYTGNVRPHSAFLRRYGTEETFRWKSEIRFNNILLTKAAVLEGCGIGLDIPLHHCIDDILAGTLIPILDGWHIPNLDNYIGTTQEAGRLKRVQAFIDWYIEKRRGIEGEQKRRVRELYPFLSFD